MWIVLIIGLAVAAIFAFVPSASACDSAPSNCAGNNQQPTDCILPSCCQQLPACDGTGVAQVQANPQGILSAAEIAAVARNAGFSGIDLTKAVAIALAESGGDSGIYNPETAAKGGTPTGQGSYGLWQIYRKAHPEFADWDLTDPQINADAAFQVYVAAGNSFSPWSTYNTYLSGKRLSVGTGPYLAKMPAAEAGVLA